MGQKQLSGTFVVAALTAVVLGGAFLSVRAFRPGSQELTLVPEPVPPATKRPPSDATQVGVGTSQNADATVAAREALNEAVGDTAGSPPNTVFVFATSPGPLAPAAAEVRRQFGPNVRLYGGTSDWKGLLTHRGLVSQESHALPALAMMTIASSEVTVGVGSALFARYPSLVDAARAAAAQAVESAGRGPNERPRAVLIASTAENVKQGDVLAGIGSVVGHETPVLGGKVGAALVGESPGEGVAVAIVYTNLPFGWTFEGGYDVSGAHSGVITRMEGEQHILEIDGRPALDVYDEWLGGELRRLYREYPGPVANDYLALNPLYTRHRSPRGVVYSIFSHVWPTDPSLQKKSLDNGTKVVVGDRLHLANGTWETLLNRVSNLPRSAQQRGDIGLTQPIFGFGYVCAGVFSVIPSAERRKAPLLMSQNQGGTPFLAVVSWGEHGYLPGVGNKYGNLLSSFLVIGPQSRVAAAH